MEHVEYVYIGGIDKEEIGLLVGKRGHSVLALPGTTLTRWR